MGRPIKWSFQPDKRHEAIAKDACGGYEKLKADHAEKEKMLAEIKQEQAAAISDLEARHQGRNVYGVQKGIR